MATDPGAGGAQACSEDGSVEKIAMERDQQPTQSQPDNPVPLPPQLSIPVDQQQNQLPQVQPQVSSPKEDQESSGDKPLQSSRQHQTQTETQQESSNQQQPGKEHSTNSEELQPDRQLQSTNEHLAEQPPSTEPDLNAAVGDTLQTQATEKPAQPTKSVSFPGHCETATTKLSIDSGM